MPLAQHHQMMKMGRGTGAIFKIDAYDGRFLRHRPPPAVLKICWHQQHEQQIFQESLGKRHRSK